MFTQNIVVNDQLFLHFEMVIDLLVALIFGKRCTFPIERDSPYYPRPTTGPNVDMI